MNKVVEFLNANPVQYLATVGRDGKAKCRPFMFAGELDGKLWFCTNNTKDVYKDMQENPEVEISVSSPEYAWMHMAFLQKHQRGMYLKLLLAGKLTAYLNEIDNAAREQVELLIRQMAAKQGVTESLKATNQMAWVGAMNQIKHSAEEIVLNELIYR